MTPQEQSSLQGAAPSLATACKGCDLLHVIAPPVPGQFYECDRCGATLASGSKNSIDRVLILSLSGLLLYPPAMLLPLITLSSIGFTQEGNVIQSAASFWHSGYYVVALMVFCSAIIFPFLKLILPFTLALSLKLNRSNTFLKNSLKFLTHLEEWGMVEVYLLGILVTLIKISGMASITYDYGFFCFIGLVLLTMATSVNLDRALFWSRLDHTQHPTIAVRLPAIINAQREQPMQSTALQYGMTRCHQCGLLNPSPHKGDASSCHRCHAPLHARTTQGMQWTWALVLTSLIFIFPANILPIMEVDFLGVPQRSTILDGILYFFKEGSYGIGLIILTASILVPLFKVVGMLILLFTTQSGKNRFLKQKAGMFRFIKFIGRWSMLDIFVIALLTVLVDFGFFTSIHTAPAATYFTLVVISTMCAAIVFDPRLMWDRCAPLDSPSGEYHAIRGRP
jgi:paraquat-inducible protein A